MSSLFEDLVFSQQTCHLDILFRNCLIVLQFRYAEDIKMKTLHQFRSNHCFQRSNQGHLVIHIYILSNSVVNNKTHKVVIIALYMGVGRESCLILLSKITIA